MTAELFAPPVAPLPEQAFAEADPARRALEQLRHDMWYNADRSDVVRNTFEAVRVLGDDFLLDSAGGQRQELAQDLGRAWAASPTTRFSEGRIENGSVAHFSGTEGLKMDDENILFEARNLAADMRAAGIRPRHHKDAELAIRVYHSSHELGHELDHGLGVHAAGDTFGVNGLATYAYIATHPEKGMVADYRISARAHAERFAQGMAIGVTTRALRTLGYTRGETKKIIAMKAARLDMSGEFGANQLDYIDEPNMIGALKATANSGTQLAAVHDNYGVLGYQLPHTPKEMVAEVLEMSSMEPVRAVDRQAWTERQFANRQSNKANQFVRQLQTQRREIHGQQPENRGRVRAAAQALGSLVLPRLRRRNGDR